jgi:hypothetical protein
MFVLLPAFILAPSTIPAWKSSINTQWMNEWMNAGWLSRVRTTTTKSRDIVVSGKYLYIHISILIQGCYAELGPDLPLHSSQGSANIVGSSIIKSSRTTCSQMLFSLLQMGQWTSGISYIDA